MARIRLYFSCKDAFAKESFAYLVFPPKKRPPRNSLLVKTKGGWAFSTWFLLVSECFQPFSAAPKCFLIVLTVFVFLFVLSSVFVFSDVFFCFLFFYRWVFFTRPPSFYFVNFPRQELRTIRLSLRGAAARKIVRLIRFWTFSAFLRIFLVICCCFCCCYWPFARCCASLRVFARFCRSIAFQQINVFFRFASTFVAAKSELWHSGTT